MNRLQAVVGILLILVSLPIIYFNLRPWPRGAWDAADLNRDGTLTRHEMLEFGQSKPHRNWARLMMHFDAADQNRDQIVDDLEIERYGTNIGSKDPLEHLPPGATT